MAIQDVCRLCLTRDELVWIFDKRLEDSNNMKDVIFITTGVEITTKDIISQKICKKCCQVTIKMFEFRRTSQKNDQYLRDQCKILLQERGVKIPNTQITIRSEKKTNIPLKSEIKTDNSMEVKQVPKPIYKIHPSVRQLFKVYPQIKLPTVCLKYDITPSVSMPMDLVENYFKSRNLDFQKCTKLALKPRRVPSVAVKKTSGILKTKSPVPPKPKHFKTDQKDEVKSSTNITSNKITDPISKKVAHQIQKTADHSSSKSAYHSNSKSADHSSSKSADHSSSKSADHSCSKSADHSSSKSADHSSSKSADHRSSKSADHSSSKSADHIKSRIHAQTDYDSKKNKVPGPTRDEQPTKKRKISETDTTEKKESKKSNFVESLGLAPAKTTDSAGTTLSYVANKSMPLHICEICNSVQYTAKDLRKHQNRHLRCQFCKMRFRSLEIKEEHLEHNCPIKNMMKHLPDVRLQRIETNEWAQRRYPEAFEDLNYPKKTVLEDSVSAKGSNTPEPINQISSSDDDTSDKAVEVTGSGQCEVIEILSDEEETANSSNISRTDPSVSNQQSPAVQTVQQENVVYNTVSIVKPDIKIKGNSALELIDARLTDIKVLKELLTLYKPVALLAEKDVQTEVPANNSILINRIDMSAELKGLKPQLHVYRVPITMKNGVFHVSYSYNVEPKPLKKLCLWNDLTAIDIKPPSVNAIPKPNDSGASRKSDVYPSTATYTSPGLVSKPQQSPTSKFIRVSPSSLCPITTANFSNPITTLSLMNVNPMLNNLLQHATSPIQNYTSPIQSSTTLVQNLTPPIQNATPSIQNVTPSIQNVTPPVQSSTPPLQNLTPRVQSSTPSIKSPTPQIQTLAPPIPSVTPPIQNSTLRIENSTPPIKNSTPPMQIAIPQTSVTTVQTSSTETSGTNTAQQFGIIRVKNVWELT